MVIIVHACATKYFETVMGCSLDDVSAVPVSGWRVVEILWPLNAIFREHIHCIRSIKYRPEFEQEADKAIDLFAADPCAESWASVSPGAWRVLLERHMQIIMVAIANEAAGNATITVLPSGLPEESELPGIMLVLLREMTLLWPPEDRSRLELSDIPPPESLTLH
jgi:hypothetical protein